jgi:predicted aspartyl protease
MRILRNYIFKLLIVLAIFELWMIQSIVAQDPTPHIRNELGFRLPEGKHQHNIPFELIDNLIVVKIVMNKTLPLKFIVDTGVRTSILTEKTFTDLMNVTYSRKIEIPVAGGKQIVTAYVAPNITMNISGVVGKGHALLVLEEDLLQLKNILGHNVQGILGYELFSRFIIEINYNRKVMTLYEPKAFQKRNLDNKKKYYRLPITIEDTKPYCYSTITFNSGKEIRAKLMLDTGASHAILLDEESSEDIVVPAKSIRSHIGRGLGGDINGDIARIKKLDLIGYQFEDVIVTFPEKQFYEQGYTRVYRNGTIGGSIFSRFIVVFDFMDGYVYLKKNSKYRDSFEYNMSGIVIKAQGLYLNTFEIIDVRVNSAAARADIQKGDKIIRINNHLASDLELGQINGVFNSKPKKIIRLELFRNGKVVRRKFKLERLI